MRDEARKWRDYITIGSEIFDERTCITETRVSLLVNQGS